MLVYTSYFAMLKKIPKDKVPVSIARFSPNWFKGLTCDTVAPSVSMLRMWKNDKEHKYYREEDFKREYLNYTLGNIDPEDFIEWLKIIGEGKDIVLCCYEKPEDTCHRHFLSEWLNNAGIFCEELEFD